MIALSTGSLYNYGIARVFALAAETGYDGVEVLIDGRWDSRDPVYLRRLSLDYGLPIVALHSPFVAEVQGWPTDQLGRLDHTVALASELAVPVVVAHLPTRYYGMMSQVNFWAYRRVVLPIPWLRREPYFYYLRDGRLQQLESSSGVIVAVENMPAHRFLGLTLNAYWFNRPKEFSRFRHMALDTSHLGTWGIEPVGVYEQFKQRVAHVHLSNFDGREHRSPANGKLHLGKLLHHLSQDGYAGVVSVEGAPDALEAEDEGKCQTALKRALNFCREHLAR